MKGKESSFGVWTIDVEKRTAVRSDNTYECLKDALDRAKSTREYHKTKLVHGRHTRVLTVKDDIKIGEKLVKVFGMAVYQDSSRLIIEEKN